MSDTQQIEARLAAPFDPREVKFRPGAVRGSQALAMPYVDARAIQDRLDEVLGVAGWQDEYEFLSDGNVLCRLRLKLGGEWIVKMDVGGPSEQPDSGDRCKAAVSDALKRAAVKFGLGRYLYRLAPIWVEYDPQKKRFAGTPALPPAALPGRQGPSDGQRLERRLKAREAELINDGLCKSGELLAAARAAGSEYGPNIAGWPKAAFGLASQVVKRFEARRQESGAGDRESGPGPSDPAKPIGQEQKLEISQLMKRAGKLWDNCRSFLRLPHSAGLADITVEQYQRLKAKLEETIGKPEQEAAV